MWLFESVVSAERWRIFSPISWDHHGYVVISSIETSEDIQGEVANVRYCFFHFLTTMPIARYKGRVEIILIRWLSTASLLHECISTWIRTNSWSDSIVIDLSLTEKGWGQLCLQNSSDVQMWWMEILICKIGKSNAVGESLLWFWHIFKIN